MRRVEWKHPKIHFTPPEITKFSGRLAKFRHEQRIERRKEGPVRHMSAAHRADALLDQKEAEEEAVSRCLRSYNENHHSRKFVVCITATEAANFEARFSQNQGYQRETCTYAALGREPRCHGRIQSKTL